MTPTDTTEPAAELTGFDHASRYVGFARNYAGRSWLVFPNSKTLKPGKPFVGQLVSSEKRARLRLFELGATDVEDSRLAETRDAIAG